jgi:hypothetical protein
MKLLLRKISAIFLFSFYNNNNSLIYPPSWLTDIDALQDIYQEPDRGATCISVLLRLNRSHIETSGSFLQAEHIVGICETSTHRRTYEVSAILSPPLLTPYVHVAPVPVVTPSMEARLLAPEEGRATLSVT